MSAELRLILPPKKFREYQRMMHGSDTIDAQLALMELALIARNLACGERQIQVCGSKKADDVLYRTDGGDSENGWSYLPDLFPQGS